MIIGSRPSLVPLRAQDLTLEIQRIWNLRYQGKIREAQSAYIAFCGQLNITPGGKIRPRFEELLKRWTSVENVVDFLLVEISFLRRKLSRAESVQQLDELEACMKEAGHFAHFQFHLQSGLNALVDANFSKAIEEFMAAKSLARCDREFSFASLSIIVAMEGLGYAYESQLVEFFDDLSEHRQEDWAQTLIEEYIALQARSAFRTGNLGTVARLFDEPVSGSQAVYFLSWLQMLPYFNFGEVKPSLSSTINSLVHDPTGYLVPYRLRTLSYLLTQEDLRSDVKISAKAERLYLWVWRWLCTPDINLLDKISKVKNHLSWRSFEHLTDIHFLLLSNSFRWLALFSGQSLESVDTSLGPVTRCMSGPVPVLEYEQVFINLLFALRDGNLQAVIELTETLRKHPLADSAFYFLPNLLPRAIPTESDSRFGMLRESIADITGTNTRPDAADVISIHALTQQVYVKTGEHAIEVRSRSLTNFLMSFRHSSCCHILDILQLSFGIGRYDAVIHDPKLANLINRANQSCRPLLQFSRRGSHIYCKGDLGLLHFYASNPHTQQLGRNLSAHELLHVEDDRSIAQPQFALSQKPTRIPTGWVSRQELQAFLGISSSSAIRRIRDWLGSGLVQKKGTGKSSTYFVTRQLERRFLSHLERRLRRDTKLNNLSPDS